MDAGKRLGNADFELNFAEAGDLMAELSRERLRLLAALRTAGPLSVYALAKKLARNYSNVRSDVKRAVKRLLALGLIERDADKRVSVPWTQIRIRLPLATAAQRNGVSAYWRIGVLAWRTVCRHADMPLGQRAAASRGSGFFADPTRLDRPWRIALEPIAKRTIYPRLPAITCGTKGQQDIRRETNIDDFL